MIPNIDDSFGEKMLPEVQGRQSVMIFFGGGQINPLPSPLP